MQQLKNQNLTNATLRQNDDSRSAHVDVNMTKTESETELEYKYRNTLNFLNTIVKN